VQIAKPPGHTGAPGCGAALRHHRHEEHSRYLKDI
jgi:hypothetical protein